LHVDNPYQKTDRKTIVRSFVKSGRHDIQHNETQHNDTQHNNIEYNETQHKELFATLSIKTLGIDRHYAECCVSFIVMLNAIMLSVVMLNVAMLSVVAPNSVLIVSIFFSVNAVNHFPAVFAKCV
jgi:hypothetical protein